MIPHDRVYYEHMMRDEPTTKPNASEKPPTSESSAAAGAVLPMTYDYWRDGICGSGPNAANIVAYNGEDVRPIAHVENDLDREAIIRKHNNIVRRLSTAGSVGVPEAVRNEGMTFGGAVPNGTYSIVTGYQSCRIVDDRFAQGWNECRAAMLAAAPAPKESK